MARTKTPTTAIARALKALGLKQGSGKDFKVEGHYQGKGKDRERIGTYALLLNATAEKVVTENADAIEETTGAEGFSFRVSIYYLHDGRQMVSVKNFGDRIREDAPVAVSVPVIEQPAPAEVPETVRAYMAGKVHDYFVRNGLPTGDGELQVAARKAVQDGEEQVWTGGRSVWVSGSKAVLLEVAQHLYELAELVSTGVVTAAAAGGNAKVIEKAAIRFATAQA
ncbi:hypothetical protein AB0A05_26840 [Streptomyces sp. NPDC046374]|uniref:hypothetical protein n=1 Tax=Streptomyces sp. NPDC046374 TaxID=3154917 RepID=UPI0033E00956